MRLVLLYLLIFVISSGLSQIDSNGQTVPAWYQTIMDGCFFRGRESVENRRNFNCSFLNIDLLWEHSLNEQCKVMFQQGCAYALAKRHCNQGADHAQQSGICKAFPELPLSYPIAYQKRCCEVCLESMHKFEQENRCPHFNHPPVIDLQPNPSKSSLISNIMPPKIVSTKNLPLPMLNFGSQVAEMLDSTYAHCCSVHRNRILLRQITAFNHFLNEQEPQFVDRCQTGNVCEHFCIDSGEATVQCSCNDGYDLAENGRNCIDRDECSMQVCPINQICQNTPGSFYCVEITSKRNNELQLTIEDEEQNKKLEEMTTENTNLANEPNKQLNNFIKPSQKEKLTQQNVNTITKEQSNSFCNGSFDPYLNTCVPNTTNNSTVIDNYEVYCKYGTCDSVPESSVKTVTENNKNECSDGYQWSQQANLCEDTNECTNEHIRLSCIKEGKFCINTIGSYKCLPFGSKFNCDKGLIRSGRDCIDIDECKENNERICLKNQTCYNTLGSYVCKDNSTLSGLNINNDRSSDSEISYLNTSNNFDKTVNKTIEQSDLIKKDKFTTNHNKNMENLALVSKSVATSTVYSTDLSVDQLFDSLDSKESETVKCQINTCNEDQKCSILDNQVKCEPKCLIQTQRYNMFTNNCDSIDPCSKIDICETGEECINYPNATYRCLKNCENGYIRNKREPFDCLDIDECKEAIHHCILERSKCINTNGSYYCECLEGFEHPSEKDKLTCKPINFCKTKCKNGVCHFKFNGYECRCNRGYIKNDKDECVDFDECKEKPLPCPGHCTNLDGSYKCEICSPGFEIIKNNTNTGDKKVSCARINLCKKSSCPSEQKCISTTNKVYCVDTSCPENYKLHENYTKTCVAKLFGGLYRIKNHQPYALAHRIIILPHNYGPKNNQSDYIYLLRATNRLKEFQTHVHKYEYSLNSSLDKEWIENHFELKKNENGDLALKLKKELSGLKSILLNVDLIYRKRNLYRTNVHIFVD